MNKSYRVVLLFLAIFANVHCENTDSQKLEKSLEEKTPAWKEAEPNEFSYMATILLMSKYTCFGSIIHKYFILTTAQCIWGVLNLKRFSPDTIRIVLGNNINIITSKGLPVKDIMVPNEYQYSIKPTTHNVALVQLAKPIEFSDSVKPVSIGDKIPEQGKEGWVSLYWNSTQGSEMIFKKVGIKLPVLDGADCKLKGSKRKEAFVCMKKQAPVKGECSKAGGSPLVIDEKLVGLGASIWSCKGKSNAEPYTNVVTYSKWIKEKIKDNEPQE